MRVLCSMPGRFGDILWSLATAKCLSQAYGTPVDFAVSPKYASIVDLIQVQDYIRLAYAISTWEVVESAPMTPREAPMEGWIGARDYAAVYHLGYDGWPKYPLPEDCWQRARVQYGDSLPALDLDRPWISAPSTFVGAPSYIIGWSDEWLELKIGLTVALLNTVPSEPRILGGSRLGEFRLPALWKANLDWRDAAGWIANARFFLGCCSSLHVLACALGKKCLIVEPSSMRHHPIFWPYGMDGPRVTIVRGIDGQPSFDARHTKDAVEKLLQETT